MNASDDELLYRVALTMIPELGPVCAKALTDHFGDAVSIFKAKKKELAAVESMGAVRARYLKEWNQFAAAEEELAFIAKHQVKTLFLTDPAYPQRLLHCYDPPTLLYYRGVAELNCPRIVSIIGTRNHSEYGKQVTEQLVAGLHAQQVLVVSGLAFGIDALAHRAALQSGSRTVGVLAHGLDTMYPVQHKALAREMLAQGGLLTEFRKNTKPDKHNFPRRNRIVAGLADATVVIETATRGGSMITAELAHNYNRDLFAVPGRTSDLKSSGCLRLIQQNKAMLFTSTEQLIETLGWEDKKKKHPAVQQRDLFVDLTPEEKKITGLLQEKGSMAIDELYIRSGLSSSSMAVVMLQLELKNIVSALPGKHYQLIDG